MAHCCPNFGVVDVCLWMVGLESRPNLTIGVCRCRFSPSLTIGPSCTQEMKFYGYCTCSHVLSDFCPFICDPGPVRIWCNRSGGLFYFISAVFVACVLGCLVMSMVVSVDNDGCSPCEVWSLLSSCWNKSNIGCTMYVEFVECCTK